MFELRHPLHVPLISGHSSWRRQGGVLIIHLKDAHDLAKTLDPELELYDPAFMSNELH